MCEKYVCFKNTKVWATLIIDPPLTRARLWPGLIQFILFGIILIHRQKIGHSQIYLIFTFISRAKVSMSIFYELDSVYGVYKRQHCQTTSTEVSSEQRTLDVDIFLNFNISWFQVLYRWIRNTREILLFLRDWPSNKSLCLQFLAIIYNFTFHTRSDFPLTILRARRWTELATDVFTAGLTWWTCHILTEILIERVLKTIFLLWPNWLFISPLIWPSIAIKMPAHLTEPRHHCLQPFINK